MKKVSKVLLPAIIVLMGAGAAFATNVAKNTKATETGYFNNSSGQCIAKDECSNILGSTCTWEDASGTMHPLNRLSGTSCSNQLAKRPN